MTSAVMIAVISDVRILTVRNLAIVLFVTLLINPANIFSISFQPSAIATFFMFGLFDALKPYALKRQFLSPIWQTMIANMRNLLHPFHLLHGIFRLLSHGEVLLT